MVVVGIADDVIRISVIVLVGSGVDIIDVDAARVVTTDSLMPVLDMLLVVRRTGASELVGGTIMLDDVVTKSEVEGSIDDEDC